MPAVWLVGASVVIMIGDERAGGLGFFLQQVPLLNRSCDSDCICQCVGLLDFYVNANVISKTCNKTSYEKTLREAVYLM